MEVNFKIPELVKLKNKVYVGIAISYSFDLLEKMRDEENIDQIGIIFRTKSKIIYYHELQLTELIKFPKYKNGRIVNTKDYLNECIFSVQNALISSESLKYFIVNYCYKGNYESWGYNRSLLDFETPYWKKLEKMFKEYKQLLNVK